MKNEKFTNLVKRLKGFKNIELNGTEETLDISFNNNRLTIKGTEFIKKFPKGFNEIIGENGSKLSGGQKQRVAIARAFIRNSPFLLLDEATSSLDSRSEKKIQDSLDKLISNKTALIIAHRLSTVIDADRIVIINNGEVVDAGKHSTLIKNSKIYRHLHDLQFKTKNEKNF